MTHRQRWNVSSLFSRTAVFLIVVGGGLRAATAQQHPGAVATSAPAATVLLVAMQETGTVEQFDLVTGTWLGTALINVPDVNGLAWGPEEILYVTTGRRGGSGTVKRFDGRSGRFLGDLVNIPAGETGALVRATGLAFDGEDLLVISCEECKIKRFNAKSGRFISEWQAGPPTSLTQMRCEDGTVYVADFNGESIRRFESATGKPLDNLVQATGFHPWGLVLHENKTYWSGSDHTIRAFDGKSDAKFANGELKVPIWLELGPDKNLYCSDFEGNAVDVFSTATADAGARTARIEGPKIRGPIGLAFTSHRISRTIVTLGGESKPTTMPAPVIRVDAVAEVPAVMHLGWDTEGGDRARHNILRTPLELAIQTATGSAAVDALPAQGERIDPSTIRYRITVSPKTELTWELRADSTGALAMHFNTNTGAQDEVKGLQLRFRLNPRLAATSILAAQHDLKGVFQLPAIINAPDWGQMLMTVPDHANVTGRLIGNRAQKWVDFSVDLPAPDAKGFDLNFSPVVLPPPADLQDKSRWPFARRGWFNLLHASAQERGAGVWANNVISNAVSSLMYWLGDHVMLVPEAAPGVPLAPFLRRSLEFWMYDGIQPDGRVHYTEGGAGSLGIMDSNPSILIGAWCYVQAADDLPWAVKNIERLELIAAFMEGRDIDHDGIIESIYKGNSSAGGAEPPDNAWDTYSAGHKNAYVNALAYRGLRCLADLERRARRIDKADHYDDFANRMKSIYYKTFINPETGWLGWWRSEDGVLHDVASDVPTNLAITFGLVDAEQGRAMLDAYWSAFQKTGFDRFDLGMPLNIRPVIRANQTKGGEYYYPKKEDGSDTFGRWLNGGCCVSNTYYFFAANYTLGYNDRADKILDAMLKRQHDGAFPNGGGFQNGFVDSMPGGAEFFEWDGKPSGYEGHLVYSWAFEQAIFLRESEFRRRLFGILHRGTDD